MPYKNQRFWNNLEKANFRGKGFYRIPEIKLEKYKEVRYIGFNYANQCRNYEGKGVHFFLDDYQFERIWNKFDRSVNMLAKFEAVLSPDWSMYTNWPYAVQIWNHYRKHFVGAYLQQMGVTVYPTICWSDRVSIDFCFDGEPHGGCVAVSSIGTQMRENDKTRFMYGYDAMLEILEPETILFYGNPPAECRGNIVRIQEFHKRFDDISDFSFSEGECEDNVSDESSIVRR